MTRERKLHYQIQTSDSGLTVEQFLRRIGCSHRVLIRLKETPGGILLNQRPVFSSRRLSEGDLLSVCLREDNSSASIEPVPMDLSILFEDEDLLVINKPAGVPVHPSQGNHGNTLANGIAWYFLQKGEPFVYRAVNRLDRDTSGLLILAKHSLSACILSGFAEARAIRREYLAIVRGLLPESGTITAPIAREPGSVLRRYVPEEGGDFACTRYRRLYYDPSSDHSLASIRLETGRTHQIRVHFSHIGHPLPGDFLYHPDFTRMARQPLHSRRLEFPHPITKAPLAFTAPVPDDMRWMCPSSLSSI